MQKIYVKKSLGQNFLKSELALRKIIETGEISSGDIILEIGPGKGALTNKLLATGCQVIAVEKDRELFEFLKTKFEKNISSGQLKLVNEDILNLVVSSNFSSLRPSRSTEWDPREAQNRKSHPDFKYKLIANIPYNITGAVLKKFLGGVNQPEMMVLMLQNEVAKRIIARDGKESILSISVKAYGDPKMIMKVPARYFSPSPKVDSAIISIKNISRKLFIKGPETVQSSTLHSLQFEDKFWGIIHAGFAHKRKKLSSNLKIYKNESSKTVINNLKNKRAEELTLTDWINLVKSIDINKKE